MKKINGAALLQTSIMAAYCLAFTVLLLTGQIKKYVHPRIEIYAWLAVAALLLMTASMIPMITKPRRHHRWLPSFLLILPLLTGFALPPAVNTQSLPLNNSLLPKAASGTTVTSAPNAPSSNSTTVSSAASSSPTGPSTGTTSAPSSAPSAPDSSQTTITDSDGVQVVQDDDFLKWLNEVCNDPSAYKGKTVKLRGFVYRESTFQSNEFVPARMSMVCCAADITACGFLCRSGDAQKWKTNDWVWVTATIDVEYVAEFQDTVPVLTAKKIEPAEKPKEEIAYPY